MSVVISAKYKDGIAIIADKQVTCGTTKSNNGNKLQYFKYSNSAIGVVGSSCTKTFKPFASVKRLKFTICDKDRLIALLLNC